ncbi:DUF305 domain-containing protein [Phyllobacterium myrsinacearum]|uniref:DUF305 domain-containing protein n=1 Tax=Phyllobacterium myrsinacearum TaxID=28101 RepID=UPI001FE04515|nr:DUF305 domain-containing protein [Phyllobacterium myrsinacearum]
MTAEYDKTHQGEIGIRCRFNSMKLLKTSTAYLFCALLGAAVTFVSISTFAPSAEMKSPSQFRQLVSNLMSVCNLGIEKFGDETAYLVAMNNSMERMMYDMVVSPTGALDHDFVEMMTPHHRGAIDMAQNYLRFGSNEQLKRIAQEIIVDQQQEIAAMRLAIGEQLPPSAPAPTQVGKY